MRNFCSSYSLNSLIKQPTCFRKSHFQKLPPKVVTYRDFKRFENERFMDSLKLTLNSQDVDYTKNPQLFFELCWNELEHLAPRKKKYMRRNNKPFMTKALSKSIRQSFSERWYSLYAPPKQSGTCDRNVQNKE